MNAKQWIVKQWAKEKAAAARVWFNFLGIWVSLDQTAGMVLGFIMHPASTELWPDETLSARCGRIGHRYPYKFWRWFIDTFLYSWWQGPNHCVNAYRKELTRYHFHPSMRGKVGFDIDSDGQATFSGTMRATAAQQPEGGAK